MNHSDAVLVSFTRATLEADLGDQAGIQFLSGHEGVGLRGLDRKRFFSVKVLAMAEAFQRSEGQDLAERLMRTLETGMAAGGQVFKGQHLPEYASSLAVYDGKCPYPAVDLRVDFDLDAVRKLRRLLTHITGSRADKYFEVLRKGDLDQIDPTWIFEVGGNQI